MNQVYSISPVFNNRITDTGICLFFYTQSPINCQGHSNLLNILFGKGNHKKNKIKSYIVNSTMFNDLTIKSVSNETLLSYSAGTL